MRSCWMLAAAGLLLAACRSDGERGELTPKDHALGPAGTGQAPAERAPVGVEATGTSRLLAAIRAVAQGEVDTGKLAQQKASSSEVKDYAVRSVAEHQATLDALSDLVKAKKIDLDATTVQGDPLLRAQKDTGKDFLDRLRALSGTAFDATYMTAQRPAQALLAQLAQQGPLVSRDGDVANVLRAVGQQAHDRQAKALSILPKACGGDRAGWGGAG